MRLNFLSVLLCYVLVSAGSLVAADQVLITEFMAANTHTLADEDGSFEDWIEICNAGTNTVNLDGWYLKDSTTSWRFPQTNIEASAFLIVFASNKDRHIAGRPLHTNFKLDRNGEYLALLKPDGVTVASAYAPSYPFQAPDVSYGLPVIQTPVTLISTGAPARFLVPPSGSADTDWTAPDFNDAAWTPVNNGIGFEADAAAPFSPVTLADSIVDFRSTQGSNNWYYGFWDKTSDADGVYATTEFVPFPRGTGNTLSSSNFWDGSKWHWGGPTSAPPFLELTSSGGQASGSDGNPSRTNLWAIRRWVSETNGQLRITGTLACNSQNGTCGDGTVGHILVDGVEVFQRTVFGTSVGYSVIVSANVGSLIDFVIDAGPGNDGNCDGTTFTAVIRTAGESAVVADSYSDWSDSGVQGVGGWSYGFWVRTNTSTAYAASFFTPFPSGTGPQSSANFWEGAQWKWFNGDPPFDTLGQILCRPSQSSGDSPDALQHWVIRRWVSEISGSITIDWHFGKQDLTGEGTVAKVFRNGTQLDTISLTAADFVGTNKTIAPFTVQAGDVIDFTVEPGNSSPFPNSIGDICFLNATISGSTTLANQFASDVGAAMRNVSASAYLRIPFVLTNVLSIDALTLRLKYDDGVVVYLNGAPVASRNAPDAPVSDSAATVSRLDAQSSQFEEVNLARARDLLHVGTNVLALHGLNSSASDGDFLAVAELRATLVTLDPAGRSYFLTPTPGALNGPGSTTLGPQIVDVSHAPHEPTDDEDLVVTARVVPTLNPIGTVRLYYRVQFGSEASVIMSDDGLHGDGLAGDGVYGATISKSLSTFGQMVRYYITATDTQNNLMRDPPFADPLNSAQYYGAVVQNPTLTNPLPVLHLFITDANMNGANGDSLGRYPCSVYYLGEFYDNSGINRHGQSSAGFPKKSYDLSFNSDHHFLWDVNEKRVSDINMLTTYPDKAHMRNLLAYEETYRPAGSPYHFVAPVRVQTNGGFFGDWHLVENGGSEFLKRIGRDPNGALYKMYVTFTSPSDANLGVNSNAEKKTRKYEGNGDLVALYNGVHLTGTNLVNYIYDNMNVSEVANTMAARIVTSDIDCCHKNYYFYRDSDGTGEWEAFPWDVDLSYGRNWQSGETYWDDRVYPNNGLFVGNNNSFFQAFFNTPATRQMYMRRLRTLMDDLQQTNGTPADQLHYEKQIDKLAALLAPDAALDLAKWGTWGGGATGITSTNSQYWRSLPDSVAELKTNYMVRRRAFVFDQKMGNASEFPDAQPTNVVIRFGALDYNPISHNQAEEFIQLINTNRFAVDLSGWTLSGGVDLTFPGGAVIPMTNSMYVVADKNAFRHRSIAPRGGMGLYVEGPYKGQLSARGETLILKDNRGRIVSTNAYVGAPSAAQLYLRITEIMYHPPDPGPGSPYLQEEFEFIEFKNIGPVAINLTGVHFTNGLEFAFGAANRTNLNAGETLILAKNLAAFAYRYPTVTNVTGPYIGSLNNGGETLRLDDAVGEKILEVTYNNSWYRMTDGNGFSLVIVDENAPFDTWGDQSSWRYSSQFNGSPGVTDPPPTAFPNVLVNEVFAHSVPLDVDFIELYNPTAAPVDVGNWWISDDFLSPRKYRIPAATLIPAGGYRVFTESDFNNPPSAANSFAFSSSGDEAYIFSGDATGNVTGYYDGFAFGASEPGVSFGRYFTSQTNLVYVAQKVSTPGLPNAGPKVGPIVISEIMYHPPDIAALDDTVDEFVELQNISASAVPLFDPVYPTNRWRLDNAIQFAFTTNTTIPAGGFLVVVSFNPTNTAQLTAFRSNYRIGPNVSIVGPYSGQLNNSEESIELKKPDTSALTNITTVLVERVHYHDSAPWDSFADGFGASLQRIVAADYGDDPTNWVATFPNPGAGYVGGTRPTITVQPTSMVAVARQDTNSFSVVATGPDLQYQWRANGTNLPGATNATLILENVEMTQAGDYQVIVFNGAGGVFSDIAHFAVVAPVSFVMQPQSQNIQPGSDYNITVAVAGTGTIRYQWRFEGVDIPDATNSFYAITNASIPKDHGYFSVAVADDVSSAVSDEALIFVAIRPGIVMQPIGTTNLQWQTAMFSVIATGAPPLSYRWLRQGINFLSNAPPTLIITNLQPNLAGTYRVVITNQAGSVNSVSVSLGVLADTDADGLPDFWEMNYTGNITNMSATADPDGDGMINRDEYVAGTDPTNALSVLKLTLTTTNTAVLQFVAQPNIGYTLQYRTNLNSALWNNVTSIAAQSIMQTIRVSVPKPPPESARFYRVVTPPEPQ